MPDALAATVAFAVAFAAAALLTPVAIRVACRTGFLDKPIDYKRHSRPTPYLGGAAVMAAFLPVALLMGGLGGGLVWVLGGAVVMAIIGTIDDRVMLGPLPRLVLEAAVAAAIWGAGFGWSAFNSELAGLALTIVWVVGLVNAFNLMDNLDGATGTVGMISAAGVAAVAFGDGAIAFAAAALALSGACGGFLVHNLRRPARIFLGDGGSMPVGFLIATMAMALSRDTGGLGAAAIVAVAPVVGLPIVDTTLVMVSRARRGVPLMTGGRDHLTHRLLGPLGNPQRVAIALGGVQTVLCGFGFALLQVSGTAVIAAGIAYISLGTVAIFALDRNEGLRPDWLPRPDPTTSLTLAAQAGHEPAS